MKVTNNPVTNSPVTSKPATPASASASSDVPTDVVGQQSPGYTPSPELVRLLDQVKAQPEVRSDRVQAALDRFQQGYYMTAESADKTAEAMGRTVSQL
jgi:hypothetical protein